MGASFEKRGQIPSMKQQFSGGLLKRVGGGLRGGPILESKGMHAIFQKKDKKKGQKRAKYLKIWAKMYKTRK